MLAVRCVRYVTLVALVSAIAIVGASPDASRADPPAPPAEFEGLYDELSQNLTDLETQLDAEWDGSVGTGRVAAGLSAANGNKSVGLLSATSWTRIIEMLDAFEVVGVELVKIDLHYPVFTPAFHSYLAANPPPAVPNYTYTVDNFIGYPNSLYNKLAAEIQSRGMGLWIEHSTLFNDWSTTPPGGYFADMRSTGVAQARARYLQEREDEMVLIASELSPDYYTLVDEPTTQNDNFGYFTGGIPILTADGWRDLAQDGAADIADAVPGYTSLLGAGSGTWEGRGYTERFAALPALDYIDFHLYPLASTGGDYAQNVLDWSDYVRAVDPAKKLTLGEAWLYKASFAEVSNGLDHNIIFGRDTYSFWEPLDRQMLDVLFRIVHYKDFEAVMPYWTQYYFAYLTYGDPSLEGLSSIQLVARVGQDAIPNITSVTLTGTGQRFVELLSAANDADGDGIPDSADTSDTDGDSVADFVEHFCASAANDGARRPERLDTPGDDDGDTIANEPLPGGSATFDCDGDGWTGAQEMSIFGAAGTARDQDPCGNNGWASDLTGNNILNIADIVSFLSPPRPDDGHGTFNKFNHPLDDDGDTVVDPLMARWNLQNSPADGPATVINIADLNSLLTGAVGSPARPPMFGGQQAFFTSGGTCPWPP